MSILEKYTDDELTGRWQMTKVQLYKVRKGMMTLADIDPTLEGRLRDWYNEFGTSIAKNDFENPDYTDPGFARYLKRFRDEVAADGLEKTYETWSRSFACACIGRQSGDPFCSCDMRCLTVSRYVKQAVAPTEEGIALLKSIEDGS